MSSVISHGFLLVEMGEDESEQNNGEECFHHGAETQEDFRSTDTPQVSRHGRPTEESTSRQNEHGMDAAGGKEGPENRRPAQDGQDEGDKAVAPCRVRLQTKCHGHDHDQCVHALVMGPSVGPDGAEECR